MSALHLCFVSEVGGTVEHCGAGGAEPQLPCDPASFCLLQRKKGRHFIFQYLEQHFPLRFEGGAHVSIWLWALVQKQACGRTDGRTGQAPGPGSQAAEAPVTSGAGRQTVAPADSYGKLAGVFLNPTIKN